MNMRLKKWILPNLPYVGIALFATKLGQAIRIAPGADFSGKVLHMMDGMHAAFSTAVPSFHPLDLCVGVLGAAAIRLTVYVKGKNAKKFRKIPSTVLPAGERMRTLRPTLTRTPETMSF